MNRVPLIRKVLLTLRVITKRDKCEAMNTQKQSERECGPYMVMYMLAIGKILSDRHDNFGDIINKIDHHLNHERHLEQIDEHQLARTTRKDLHELLQNREAAMRSL